MRVYLAVSAVIGWIIYRILSRKTIVYDYEKGLLYKKGRFIKVLDTGLYRTFRMATVIKKVDIRSRFVTIPGQEVLSSDGITLKLSLAAQYEIADPQLALAKTEDYQEALYLTIQLALREIVSAAAIEEILQKRNEFSEKLMTLVKDKAQAIGVNLITVNIKDIMFPGELKKIFAQEVAARKEGLAVLERTRGETAALRNLANAAKLVEGNPALLQLRTLQAQGNTFVFASGTGVVPVHKNKENNANQD